VSSIVSFISRKRDKEEGFTLIELMVVVLIIAILIAIAIPQFLGARTRAQDRAAQSSLRNALTAAKTAYTDQSSYAQATDAQLGAIEPSLTYVPGGTLSADVVGPPAVPSFKVVSVDVPAGNQTWEASVLSKSGTCFWIKDVATNPGAGTFYGSGAAAACHGTDAAGAAAASW